MKIQMQIACAVALIAVVWMAGAPAAQGAVRCLTWQVPGLTGVARTELPQPPANRELPCDYTPVGPPPDPQVGDTWDWYIWSLNGMPEATLKPCTVRGMGEHHYVVVDDDAWGVSMTQDDVDAIVNAVENESVGQWPDKGIWELNTSTFGDPPDNLDQDGKVYFLYYEFDVSADGFFWYFDQYCDGELDFASNECDVVYLSCAGAPPAEDYMLAVAAHEFQHMIHFNQDANEASWVDEGCAELAMWLYGHPDQISNFNNNPDNNLTVWNGAWADYIKTYLWTLYFFEHYGDFDAIRRLLEEPANSTAGYENVLDAMGYTESFADVFADWTVANYLDDTTIYDGRYGYLGDELPAFRQADSFNTYPVMGQQRDVSHWAADYVGFTQADALELGFDGTDNTEFAVHVLHLDDSGSITVERMSLDAGQSGSQITLGDGDENDEVVLVIGGASSSGGNSYQFNAFPASTSPTPTLPPQPSVTPTAPAATPTAPPSPTVTVTPTPPASPTAAPTSEPTIPGGAPWIELLLNAASYGPGDAFELLATIANPLPDNTDVDSYIVLDVYGDYWFWPSWRHYPEGIDWDSRTLPGQEQNTDTILSFPWPENAGSSAGICFHGILLDPETQDVLCDLTTACFDFTSG